MSRARPIVFGVLAATCTGLWAVSHSARRMSAGAVFGYAALYVIIAAAACVIAFALAHTDRRVCVRHHFVCALSMAFFLPAFVLFADRGSAWLIVPLAAIASAAALAAAVHRAAPEDHTLFHRSVLLGGPLPAASLRQEAVWSSVMLQSGSLLAALGQALWSIPFIAAGAVALTTGTFPLAPRSGLSCQDDRGCLKRLGAAAAAAILMTVIALEPHLARTAHFGSVDGPPESPQDEQAPTPGNVEVSKDDVYQGVIILPEAQDHITLVPPMPSMQTGSPASRPVIPFSMPFFGVYWVYRPPHRRPPPGSLVIRSKPVDRKLRSNDRVHLKMEARQNFGSYIDLSCCSRVDISIASRDSFHGTVLLEFVARDSGTGAQQSLGVQRVPSVRGWFRDNLPVVQETLSYPVGAAWRFDEAVLVFHLAAMRADMAARVAIERFVFIPR